MDVFCWVRLPDATTFPHKQASMMKAMVNRMSLLTFAGARAMQMSLPVESFGPQSWTCKAATRSLVASHVHLPQVRLFGVKPSDDDAEESWEPPSDYRVDDSHLSEDEIRSRKASIPDFSIVEDVPASTPSSGAHPAGKVPETKARRRTPNQMKTTSWMEKNEKFSVGSGQTSHSDSPARMDRRDGSGRREDQQNRTFREDFRGTRVFVQGLPLHATWQDVKDHFRIAGEVVFASVSKDFATGKSKGSGVVQFETTDMAKNATNVMRNYPLFGETLYVREDVQQRQDGAEPRNRAPLGGKQSTIPQTWTCGDERSTEVLTDQEKISVFSLIRARDEARKRRNYDASDDMREQLKRTYGVFVDDARKMWWVSLDGRTVPVGVKEVKGDGRWGALPPWRQIPTLPENDACVNPELVHGLLKQRDVARREKDFSTADALLEEARVSPDGELNLRIHDITRTWRVWTEKPPHRNLMIRRVSENNANEKKSPAEQCIDIITEHAPEKLEEVQSMLERYKGREFKILKELKQRYLS